MILHADADAFFASVEQRDDPRLRGRPVAVCAEVVCAASYEARAYGVRGGMSVRHALRCCPQLVLVEPRSEAYLEASRQLFELFAEITPLVEPGSMEEAFLDVSGHPTAGPVELAESVRRRARDSVGLPVSVGVARTKLLAKVASRAAKPDGLFVVALDQEVAFRQALRVDHLWGVGPATVRKLRVAGIGSVAELLPIPEPDLIALVGPAMGRRLHAIATGRDDDPVRPNRPRRSFSTQRVIHPPTRSEATLGATLRELVEGLSDRTRADGYSGSTVGVYVRLDDQTLVRRSRRLAEASAAPATILLVATALPRSVIEEADTRGINLVGVTLTDLRGPGAPVQLALPL